MTLATASAAASRYFRACRDSASQDRELQIQAVVALAQIACGTISSLQERAKDRLGTMFEVSGLTISRDEDGGPPPPWARYAAVYDGAT